MQKSLGMEEFDVFEHRKKINELDELGIHIHKIHKDGITFHCDTNPYFPKELTHVLDILRSMSNVRAWNADTMKFRVWNTSLKNKKL